ncbi:hypothetical protein PAJ35_09050, partial [Campylobacter jejuni]|nr:hypothetical protein [Campylobacter jejuni]
LYQNRLANTYIITLKIKGGKNIKNNYNHFILITNTTQNRIIWGQPSGTAVKFTRSALVAWGSPVQMLGADLRTTWQAML